MINNLKLLLIIMIFGSSNTVSALTCQAVSKLKSSTSVSGNKIIETILEPTFGQRIYDPNISMIVNKNSVSIGKISLKEIEFPEFEFRVSDKVHDVHIENIKKDGQVVKSIITVQNGPRVNRGSDIQNTILHRFINHPLHPFLSSSFLKKSYFEAKPAQKDGSQALLLALTKGLTHFTYIAPTGVGKTYVLFQGIKHMLSKLEPGLIIITADQIDVVQQLRDNLAKDPTLKNEFSSSDSIIHWSSKSPPNMKELIATSQRRARNGESTLLFATVRTITLQALPGTVAGRGEKRSEVEQDKNLDLLAKNTKSLIYDEAHHAGANRVSEFIELLRDRSESFQGKKTFFLGATATPFHHKVDLIEQLFNGKVFMALIDSVKSYFNKTREVLEGDYVNQLIDSIELSYVKNISQLYLLVPGNKGVPKDLLIQENGSFPGSRYSINKDRLPWLLKNIFIKLKQHKHGYIATPSIKDAELLQEHIEKNYPSIKTETFHSDMPEKLQRNILKRFRKKEFNHLITVHKLDEAIDLPFMTLYIDLNRSIGPRQILQRIGRVIRLDEGKKDVEVIALFDITASSIIKEIELFNDLLNQKLFGKPRKEREEGGELIDPLEVGVNFNSNNIEKSTEVLAEALNSTVIDQNKVMFIDKDTKKLTLQTKTRKNGVDRVSDKEAWEMIEMWYEDYSYLPKNPYAKSRNGEKMNADSREIWDLMVQVGGSRHVKKVLKEKESAKNSGPKSTDSNQQGGISNVDRIRTWLEDNHTWPNKASSHPTEAELARIIVSEFGGQRKFLTKHHVNSPLVRHTLNTKENRLQLLVEYLEFVGEFKKHNSTVTLPETENRPKNFELTPKEENMFLLGNELFKSLKTISNKEIADYLTEQQVLKKYPPIYYKLDKFNFYIDWVVKNRAFPRASLHQKTRKNKAEVLEANLQAWNNQQPKAIQIKILRLLREQGIAPEWVQKN